MRGAVSRHHHFLPQCYLSGFAVPRKKGDQVTAFDRQTRTHFQTNVKNVAQQRDFNRIEVDGLEPDEFEAGLAKFESDLGPALARTQQRGTFDDQKDRLLILNFASWIAVHNPRHRENIRRMYDDITHTMMAMVTATPERWENHLNKVREADIEASPLPDVPYEEMRKFIEDRDYKLELDNTFKVGTALQSMDAVLPTMLARKWWLVRAPKDSAGFITSDHPLALMWAKPELRKGPYGPGFGLAGTQVVLPLTSKLALLGAHEIEERSNDITEEMVADINGCTIAYAVRQVYARDLNFHYRANLGGPIKKANKLIADPVFHANREDD